MNFNVKIIFGFVSTKTVWIRLYTDRGLHFTRRDMLYSERTGKVKYKKLPFGWRFKFLPIRLK